MRQKSNINLKLPQTVVCQMLIDLVLLPIIEYMIIDQIKRITIEHVTVQYSKSQKYYTTSIY